MKHRQETNGRANVSESESEDCWSSVLIRVDPWLSTLDDVPAGSDAGADRAGMFFRRIEVEGRDDVPQHGPILFVQSHQRVRRSAAARDPTASSRSIAARTWARAPIVSNTAGE